MSGYGDFDRDGEDDGRPDGVMAGPDTTAQLALNDEDERLPWLESGEDEEEEGVDTGRIVGFALIGFTILALIVGLIWWLANRGPDPDMVADGGTIEAPDKPYKSKPEDPGGKEFAGTGDTSFKVGEGEVTEGKLATQEVPKPAEAEETENAEPAPSGVGVQVGAYSTKASAQAGWNTLYASNEVLKGYKHRIVQGKADIGTVYRLQAIAPNVATAESLCAKLKAAGTACQVKQ